MRTNRILCFANYWIERPCPNGIGHNLLDACVSLSHLHVILPYMTVEKKASVTLGDPKFSEAQSSQVKSNPD